MNIRAKFVLFLLLITGLHFYFIDGCPLPLAAGDWYSSSRGTWTLSTDSQNISNFRADLSANKQTSSLTCDSAGSTSTQYILHTNFEIFFGVNIDVYTCIDIRSTDSPYRFLYYIVTPTDKATGEQFTSDRASACSNSGYDTARDVHVIISKSNPLNAAINCPDVILGNYSTAFVQTDSSKVNGSLMDSCSDTKVMQFSNTDATLNHGFSSQNKVYCLYSELSGGEYFVHTFNNETENQANEIYNFACWVFAYSSNGVTGSAYPESCQQEQSSTVVEYGGHTFTFSPYVTCPLYQPEPPGFPAWAIVLIVLGAILFLAVLIVFLTFLIYTRKTKTGDDETGIVKDEEKRQGSPDSITGEKKRLDEGYDSGFEERWKTPVTQMRREREHTMDLVEVTRDDKLKEGPQREGQKEKLIDDEKLTKQQQKSKDEDKLKQKQKSKVISPREKKEQEKKEQEKKEKEKKEQEQKEKVKKEQEKKEEEKKKEELKKEQEKIKEAEKQKEAEKAKEKVETPEPVPPPGKKTIQPTTPRPAADDTTLARIKKDDKKDKKKDKKEQGVRVEETIKEEPEESSSEYEVR